MAKFTEEQNVVVEAQGKTIVSASAGSGKTTVMIGKVLELVKSGVPVSKILAVTFTTKAAAQMKDKLRKELITAINAPKTDKEQRKLLKKQLNEVGMADFSTIHSFCGKLIRSHFFEAGVDGGFSIISGSDAQGNALKSSAIDYVFDQGYNPKDEDPDFYYLLSCFWRKKKDDALKKVILSTYEQVREREDYEEFLRSSGAYTKDVFDRLCDEYRKRIFARLSYYVEMLKDDYDYFVSVGGKSADIVKNNIAEIEKILTKTDLFEAAKTPVAFTKKESKSAKHSPEYARRLAESGAIVNKIKKFLATELDAVREREVEEKLFFESGKTAASLAKYVLKFDERYMQLKKERSLLDYADLQLIALKLLQNEYIRQEIREKYEYVFVDEYQDVNPLQEKIVSAVAGENLLLVGDIKQSIYGFRGGRSVFFAQKNKDFENDPNANALKLSKNFRSTSAILDAVNAQFCVTMNKQTSFVDYLKDGVMGYGGLYGTHKGRVCIHFVTEPKDTSKKQAHNGVYSVKEDSVQKLTPERSCSAKAVRQIIERELGQKFYDLETQTEREIGYGDIAILTRNRDKNFREVVQELVAEGIPVSTDSQENICEYPEIKTLIDLLQVIDNEKQDVPFCSALLSAVGKMTASELAAIRIAYTQKDGYEFFRDACKAYAEEKKDEIAYKLNLFYEYLSKIRVLSHVISAGELLTKILAETGMERALLARDNGTECLKRIERFIQETSVGEDMNVHAFLQHLKDVENAIYFCANGGENSVHAMTVHSSKGLEFPVVIFIGISQTFSGGSEDAVKVDDDYAVITPAYDLENMTTDKTLLRAYYNLRKKEEEIKDELNIYYVALTRAKYALHLVGSKRAEMTDVKYGGSYAEMTDFSVWEQYIVKDDFFFEPYQPRETYVSAPDAELVEKIRSALSWEYAYTGLENMPVKSSATALLSQQSVVQEDEFLSHVLFEDDDGQGETSKDKILLGLAYHAFLEKFDFSATFDENGEQIDEDGLMLAVEQSLENASKNGALEREYLDVLKKEKCVEILKNPVFSRLLSTRLYKEQQFLVSLPLKDFGELYHFSEGISLLVTDEEVLFQGAIDLLAVGDDRVDIIDYKYSVKDARYLKEHYAPQLTLYKKAIAKIFKIDESKIHCTIVNIFHGFEVTMD